jgi:hypothetical protein
MRLVDPAPQSKVDRRSRLRQIIDAAAADPERFGLP